MQRVFLLSPASCSGRRAQLLMRPGASFDLAVRLRHEGLPLGDAFSFMSGLYFRGKAAYADAFGDPPPSAPGALVITPTRGLVPLDLTVTTGDLCAFADVPIDLGEPRYRAPLESSARMLRDQVEPDTAIVLLGSIASDKYVHVLLDVFDDQLLFPIDFVGRGDMSRGGLMLRAADAGIELAYVPVRGAPRRGARPPRLTPRR